MCEIPHLISSSVVTPIFSSSLPTTALSHITLSVSLRNKIGSAAAPAPPDVPPPCTESTDSYRPTTYTLLLHPLKESQHLSLLEEGHHGERGRRGAGRWRRWAPRSQGRTSPAAAFGRRALPAAVSRPVALPLLATAVAQRALPAVVGSRVQPVEKCEREEEEANLNPVAPPPVEERSRLGVGAGLGFSPHGKGRSRKETRTSAHVCLRPPDPTHAGPTRH